ncbi:Transposase IS200 like [Fibrobacter intestinalis]|uniref:Transposase IS200 like n=1 Tax=Fibrobacter intestinalis TaxID=28122 RepID=A0A1T4P9Q7_9BACT|nr:transposase IS200 family protein [Fibrobacter sp. NR9]SJZ88273.1 Transposase IS200 like [Fibrobacter intestinalis]
MKIWSLAEYFHKKPPVLRVETKAFSKNYSRKCYNVIVQVNCQHLENSIKANIRDSLSHTKWLCKYHIVFTPKYRRKAIYGQYKESIGKILRQLCNYKGVEIIEGHLMVDHIHMLVSIPPKYSVSN